MYQGGYQYACNTMYSILHIDSNKGATVGTNENAVTVSQHIGQFDLMLETGRLARQADGSVFARYGSTAVLAAAVREESETPRDFLPLTVEYRENKFAAGKIPGGFFKREGRPRRKETLTCRLIDRPLRPMFPKGFCDELQVSVFVYSADEENDPDVVGMNAASAALMVSDIPFYGPIGAVRVGMIGSDFIVNPNEQQRSESVLDLVAAGTDDSIVMVESNAEEVDEETFQDALSFAHDHIKEMVQLQLDLAEKAGVPKKYVERTENTEIKDTVRAKGSSRIEKALAQKEKPQRNRALKEAEKELIEEQTEESGLSDETEKEKYRKELKSAFEEVTAESIRAMIQQGKRVDGRSLEDIRPIWGEAGVLPGTHGSGLFTRGETQALVAVTLGSLDDMQPIKGLHPEREEEFYLHYDFLPFSVGEIRFYRSTSRREIGHGMLAQKALEPIIPDKEDFPYTMRIVSQILESNGSSSMATVCGSTLAMMDCGVKIKRPVAGIAMGLIKEGEETYILSDILGDEDHCGDMDFKVAGTQKGITALQMDIKIKGIGQDVIARALNQAKEGRIHILRKMLEIIDKPKAHFADNVPQIRTVKIDPSRIGKIIGPGGKIIKQMEADYGVDIEISDEGIVHVMGKGAEGLDSAEKHILLIVKGPEIGEVYTGIVKNVREFGAFVELVPGVEGLVHISDLEKSYVDKVEDVVNTGDTVEIKVTDIDSEGKIKLSRKALL